MIRISIWVSIMGMDMVKVKDIMHMGKVMDHHLSAQDALIP